FFAARGVWLRVLGHERRRPVVERVADWLVGVVGCLLISPRVVPAGFEAVRAGDVRRRYAIGVVGNDRVVESAGRSGSVTPVQLAVRLIGHRNHILDRCRLSVVERAAVALGPEVHVAPPLEQVHADELKEKLARDWRRELDVLLTKAREAPIAGG